MRLTGTIFTVFLTALMAAASAAAETWKARNENVLEGAPAGCARSQDGQPYTVELDGRSFTLTGLNGKFFTITIPPDGSVRHEFKSPNGGRFEISGNVLARDLVFRNLNSACKSRLVPM